MSRWLIVGCGYVGTALGQWLLQQKLATTVIGARRTSPDMPLPFPCLAAASDSPAFAKLLPAHPFDVVVYCAAAKASDPETYHRTYVRGAGALVSALQAHQQTPARLLFTSSTAVYTADDGRWVDETTPVAAPTAGGSGFRATTMAQAEQLFLQSGWPAVVLRLGGIYGPGRTSFLARVQRREVGLTDQPSYPNRMHRDDCARALAHLGALPQPGAIYNGVDDAPADRNEVVRWLSAELGVAPARQDKAPAGAGKRVSNARLRQSGYRCVYPTYREGYGALLPGFLTRLDP